MIGKYALVFVWTKWEELTMPSPCLQLCSCWFGLNYVGKSWFWWAKLYWEPSKENLRFKKIMCWKGTISHFASFFYNFFLMHFSFPALLGLQTYWQFICFVAGSEPMDRSGWWSRSSQCIQGAYNNISLNTNFFLHEFLKQVFDRCHACRSLRLEPML